MINEKELPEDYVKRMKDLLGKDYDDYIKILLCRFILYSRTVCYGISCIKFSRTGG